MTDYAIRIERCGGSANGDVVAILPTLAEAREYLDNPEVPYADMVLAIYTLEPCWEDTDE